MSICDYTNEDGIVTSDGLGDASADFRNGEIDSDLLGDVSAAFRDGTPVDGCVESTSPTPDSSTLNITTPTVTFVDTRTVDVSWTVENIIESGSGEVLDGDIDLTVNGSRRSTFPYIIEPGESTTITDRQDDLPTGDVTICVVE